MGLFSKPEVVIAKESSNAKSIWQLGEFTMKNRRKRKKNRKRDCRGESRHYR